MEVLKAAGMGIDNLVKTTVFLTSAESLPVFARVRNGFLGDARPASSVVIVSALVRPQWQVEIEAVACG